MKILLATHTLRPVYGGPEAITTPETRRHVIAWSRRRGFDGIEVGAWWFDFATAPIGELRALRDQMHDAGLEMGGFNCLRSSVVHPAVREENRRALTRAVEAAAAVGVPFVSISFSMAPDLVQLPFDRIRGWIYSPGGSRGAPDSEFTETAALLKDLARQAAPHGVSIAIELHNCSLADTSASLLRLLGAAGEPNISANPDLGNLVWGYETPEERWQDAIVALAPHVRFWHVKNVQRVHLPEFRRAAFVASTLETGEIDYRWCLARLREAGFDGTISLEGAGGGDWLGVASRNKAYLDEMLGDLAAGVEPHVR
ncbi:MAG: sugar phosphate isomerase/epimerase [Chloroflexi bacterium]|nr:sugar phosphate isomerase/epimerase [Chloroflexota bacterium]